jgi:RNA polymerase sigma-70 factor (ECF subfamily)
MSTARDLPSSDRSGAVDLGRLIADHQVGVWRYLRALGCEPAEADDLTQETFLAGLQKPIVHYSPAATAAYLRKVAFNRFVTVRRRARRVVLMEQIEEIDQTWNRLVSDDHGELLLAAAYGDCRSAQDN